jgi:phospholipase C
MRHVSWQAACVAGAILAGGCGAQSSNALPFMKSGRTPGLPATGAGKIQHIVYIVQENRSFNNLFYGYPGAYTVTSGKDSKGETILLQPISLHVQYVIDHSSSAMFFACHGRGKLAGTKCRMDGFDREWWNGGPRRVKYPQYVYVPQRETKPYFAMAHEWVLADRMFESQLDESFTAHQYVIAAQARRSVDLPYGPWGCEQGPSDYINTLTNDRKLGKQEVPCFDYETLGDELDAAKLSWRFYTSWYDTPSSGFGAVWSAYQAVNHIYNGPDWKKDVITPQKQFFRDIAKGKLANFTWITPICANSDHPNCQGGYGPSWVAALVNAIGESKYWDSTAIFVQWDDWGGLYDPVPPPFEDYDGLGFRVPLLVISPYAKHDYVSHKRYETASVLRFAEDLWGLPQLAAADKRANSPGIDCFDFTQQPRKFVRIPAPKGREFFLHQGDDRRIPDDQ